MLSIRARMWRRLGWTCVEFGARIRGRVRLGRGVFIASGAEILSDTIEGVKMGENSFLLRGALLMTYGGRIIIGKNVGINPYTVIYGHGGVTIGDNVLIATSCVIIPANHITTNLDVPISQQGLECKGIVIDDDVWLGARVTVLDGVRIGKGSVIGAGSVVTRDIPPYSIAVGVPARVIDSRRKSS